MTHSDHVIAGLPILHWLFLLVLSQKATIGTSFNDSTISAPVVPRANYREDSFDESSNNSSERFRRCCCCCPCCCCCCDDAAGADDDVVVIMMGKAGTKVLALNTKKKSGNGRRRGPKIIVVGSGDQESSSKSGGSSSVQIIDGSEPSVRYLRRRRQKSNETQAINDDTRSFNNSPHTIDCNIKNCNRNLCCKNCN